MRALTLFILLLIAVAITPGCLKAQSVDGQWHGYLRPPGSSFVMTLNLSKVGDKINGTLHQNHSEEGLSFTYCDQAGAQLTLYLEELDVEMQLSIGEDKMVGTFMQYGQSLPIEFGRSALEIEVIRRLQDPVAPFPYAIEEVSIPHNDHVLAGSLFIPEGTIKGVAIFITGSGPQTRDEEIFGHKLFLVIADDLSRAGIATLRCDDRGIGNSTGNFSTATSADFAEDIAAIVAYARNQSRFKDSKIGLLGHSEGGIIAAMVASQGGVDFVISLAGPGVVGSQILATQQRDIMVSQGMSYEDAVAYSERIGRITELLASKSPDAYGRALIDSEYDELRASGKMSEEQIDLEQDQLINSIEGPWMRYFLTLDPAPYWEKVGCPTLAMNGDKDLQVAHGANLRAIGFAMRRGGNKEFTAHTMVNHNHLFQETTTGNLSEYGELEQTISKATLDYIREWILALK